MRKQGLTRLGGLATVVVLLGACGTEGSLSGASTRVDPAVESRLRAHFPEHAARILEGRGFETDGASFHLELERAEGSTWTVASPSLRAELPKAGDEPLRLHVGGFEARVREVGAEGEGALVARAVAYRRAGGTAFWTAAQAGVEEWLHLEAGQGSAGDAVAAWEVEGGSLRESGSGVEVVDAAGVARIRVTAPEAFAAGGRAVGARLRVRGSRIELTVEASGEELLVDPVWVAAGMMGTAHYQHTATLLQSGNVLILGGNNDASMAIASAELYIPAINSWQSAGSLGSARFAHTATLLGDGTVLVAGGSGPGFPLPTRLYDPVNNTWSGTGAMSIGRAGQIATLLGDGKVLVAGGTDGSSVLTSSELYDPVSQVWMPTGAMNIARSSHTATLLDDGHVLVAGGVGVAALSSAELYDPASKAWSAVGLMSTARFAHTATALENGQVLVVGGFDGSSALTTAELYNPVSKTWTPAGAMSTARENHSATLLKDGRVLVTGGSHPPSAYLSSTEIYDPQSKSWTLTSSMNTGRTLSTGSALLSGKVLVAGGYDGLSVLASAELFLLLDGSVCTVATDCQSGFCADSVCCSTACDAGTCDACSKAAGALTDGTCALLTGPSCDDSDTCTTPDTCQAGKCVGTPIDCTTSSVSASVSSSSSGAGGMGGMSSTATGTGGMDITTTATTTGAGGSPSVTPPSSNFYTCSSTPGLPTSTPASLFSVLSIALLSARRRSLKIKAQA